MIVCMPVWHPMLFVFGMISMPYQSFLPKPLHWTLPSDFVYSNDQHMAKCSWWGKWAVTMRGSCMPWRFWRRPLLYKRQRPLSTHGRSGKCWSTSASLHSSSHFTTPSRRTPSCTSFSVRIFYMKLPSVLCRLPLLFCYVYTSKRKG